MFPRSRLYSTESLLRYQIYRLSKLSSPIKISQLRDRLTAEVGSKSGHTLDIFDSLTRTALELISQGGIGHTFNSFDKNSKEFTEFHEALKDVL